MSCGECEEKATTQAAEANVPALAFIGAAFLGIWLLMKIDTRKR